MKRSSKQADVQYKDFTDLSGGWNCRTEAKDIADNQVAQVTNMTFAEQPGRLRTRKGIGDAIKVFNNEISSMYAWHEQIVIKADGKFWRYKYGDSAVTEIGSALGTADPSFCEYDGRLYVCANSHIQKITVTEGVWAVTTLTASPADAVGLYSREGRLCCWVSGDANDTTVTPVVKREYYIFGSMVGDPDSADSWIVPETSTDLTPVQFEIGYKIEGAIVCVIPFLTDLIIFKERAIMRFTGTMLATDETSAIYELARNELIANKYSVQNVGGYLIYLDKLTGARMILSTNAYGDMLPEGIIPDVNPYIRAGIDIDYCAVWHLKHSKIILFCIGNEIIPAYYEYGFDKLPCLKWEFNDKVIDVCETDDGKTFIAVGKKFFMFNGDFDEGKGVKCSFATKRIEGVTCFLLKRLFIMAISMSSLSLPLYTYIYCNDTKIGKFNFGAGKESVKGNQASVYKNNSSVYSAEKHYVDFSKHQLLRGYDIQIIFDNENDNSQYAAPFALYKLAIEYTPIGVLG